MRAHSRAVLLLAFVAAKAAAQGIPPVRPLGPIISVCSANALGSVSYVRPLPNGDVLVHDLTRRQVVLLDRKLALKSVIADANGASTGGYTSQVAGLIPYRGDSSLFVDPQALTMTVLDDKGATIRVMAIPRPQDANNMIGGPFGTPGVDPAGRIIYRGIATPNRRNASGGPPEPGQPFRMPQPPDTAPLLRVDLVTRRTDTVAFLKIPAMTFHVSETERGFLTVVKTNPLPTVDDWALLPDGRIAVIRGRDFHVEFLQTDGRLVSSPKVSYAWERLSDEDKQRVADSATVQWQIERAAIESRVNGDTSASGQSAGSAERSRPGATRRFQGPNMESFAAKELPDYRPAFKQGVASVDGAGNLWIRTTAPSDAGPIYDLVNSNGVLIDRVKVPFGRVISGFGDGVVYLGVLDERWAVLEVARVR